MLFKEHSLSCFGSSVSFQAHVCLCTNTFYSKHDQCLEQYLYCQFHKWLIMTVTAFCACAAEKSIPRQLPSARLCPHLPRWTETRNPLHFLILTLTLQLNTLILIHSSFVLLSLGVYWKHHWVHCEQNRGVQYTPVAVQFPCQSPPACLC